MPESKFKIFDQNKNNVFQDGETFTNFEDGFEPGDIVESKPVNTGLYQATLITKALIDALNPNSDIGYSTSYTEIVNFIKEKLYDLSGTTESKSITVSTDAITLKWNKVFYKINKTVATESSFIFDSINDNIKNEITIMLTTNLVNTKIKFEGATDVYPINYGTTNVSSTGTTYTFQDKGTYILKILAKNSSVVYVEISKGEYSGTQYLSNPEITLNEMSSIQGAWPTLSFNVKNPNDVEVTPSFMADAYGITATNIPANGTKTYTKTIHKYAGTIDVSITDPTGQVFGSPNATKTWSIVPTFSKPVISFTGTGTSRTLTITREAGKGGSTTSTDYKIWRSTETEPTSYTNTTNSSYIETLSNNTYENLTYVVKARTKATYTGKTTYTEDVISSITIEGQAKPTLVAPTLSLLSQDASTINFRIINSNNVACNIYYKVGNGTFQKYSSKVNANNLLDGSIKSSIRPTTLYVYLTATNYNNSTQSSINVPIPTLVAPVMEIAECSLNVDELVSATYRDWPSKIPMHYRLKVTNNNTDAVSFSYKFIGGASEDSYHVISITGNSSKEITDVSKATDIIFSDKITGYFSATGYNNSSIVEKAKTYKTLTNTDLIGPDSSNAIQVVIAPSSISGSDMFNIKINNNLPIELSLTTSTLTYTTTEGQVNTVDASLDAFIDSEESRSTNDLSTDTVKTWKWTVSKINVSSRDDGERYYFDLTPSGYITNDGWSNN